MEHIFLVYPYVYYLLIRNLEKNKIVFNFFSYKDTKFSPCFVVPFELFEEELFGLKLALIIYQHMICVIYHFVCLMLFILLNSFREISKYHK